MHPAELNCNIAISPSVSTTFYVDVAKTISKSLGVSERASNTFWWLLGEVFKSL
jgi:hypothetical protein